MFKFTVTLPTTQHDNSSNIPAIKEIKREIAENVGGIHPVLLTVVG